MKRIFLQLCSLALCIFNVSNAAAQATVGSLDDPQPFSVLELVSGGTRGFRLPQMTATQRDALPVANKDAARGLRIFNLSTKCVDTWNGSKWIESCPPEGPTKPVFPPVECEITKLDNRQYIAKVDPIAESYEFFLDGVSQGIQESNLITFNFDVTDEKRVTVLYYYTMAALKPEMLPVEGMTLPRFGQSSDKYISSIAGFKMSKTEITQAQFTFVVGKNPSDFQCGNAAVAGRPTSVLPVDQVNWYAAITYCNKLSYMEGKTPCYSVTMKVNNQDVPVDFRTITYDNVPHVQQQNDSYWDKATCNFAADGYRLPTETEWEYAARGGKNQSTDKYSGGTDLCNLGWYACNNGNATSAQCTSLCPNLPTPSYTGPKAVAQKPANKLGLHDMSGNVWEWCWNVQSDNKGFPAVTPTGTDTSIGTEAYRVTRGGSWSNDEISCAVYTQNHTQSSYLGNGIAFRVVCKL